MRIIVLVILSYLFVYDAFSQENAKVRLDEFVKQNFKSGIISVNESVYQVDTFKMFCCVSNKKAIDYNIPSNVDMDDPSYKMSFTSIEILTDIFKENLSDKLDVEAPEKYDSIMLMMVSDLSGKITKVYFIYQHQFNIPIEAIEQIEKAIKEKCWLHFDKNAKAFLDAKYVETNCTIFLKDICH